MGRYLNILPDGRHLPAFGKADQLLKVSGAYEISEPKQWSEGIICVVVNPIFEAAAWAYSESELDAFRPTRTDNRQRRWIIVPNVEELYKMQTS